MGECDAISDKFGQIETGKSVLTNGYKLSADYIIHSVGPTSQNNKALQSCYVSALELCILHNIRSIAFPCISTGIFGFSKEIAAPLALKTVRSWLVAAKNTKYSECIKLIKEKQALKDEEAIKSKKKKKNKKWIWEKDDNDNDDKKENKNNVDAVKKDDENEKDKNEDVDM